MFHYCIPPEKRRTNPARHWRRSATFGDSRPPHDLRRYSPRVSIVRRLSHFVVFVREDSATEGDACPYTPGAKHRALPLVVPRMPDGCPDAARPPPKRRPAGYYASDSCEGFGRRLRKKTNTGYSTAIPMNHVNLHSST